MRGIFVGIDVGGTHTDGVAVEGRRVLHKVKVPTRPDLKECTLAALSGLLDAVSVSEIRRVVLSTTLVTNAVIAGEIEPTGTLLTAGPGIHPSQIFPDERCRLVPGALDHRGREITALDEAAANRYLDEFRKSGIRVLAVVGKFSVRNPAHELRIAELAKGRFDYVAVGHTLAGSLNFPRRVATAYLSAGVWRRHNEFVSSLSEALAELRVTAPLYLLRADGGTQLAATFQNPAETALSGPAASIMGVEALDPVGGETLALDVGGTTTDISLFVREAPLLEQRGATVGPFLTKIRSLYTRSLGAGGDSLVRMEGGEIRIGPTRLGPPAALGGSHPTPTDALVLLGRATGNSERAAQALSTIADALGVTVEEGARRVLKTWGRQIAGAARSFVAEVNARPVYTIHELLEGYRVRPTRAVGVGGPARAIAAYVEDALDLPIHVPDHFDVANAVGAALARVNLDMHLTADTERGYLSIPEAGVFRTISRAYSVEEARAEAGRALLDLAREKGLLDPDAVAEIAEEESFRIVQDFTTVGSIHHIRAQIRPGILGKVQ